MTTNGSTRPKFIIKNIMKHLQWFIPGMGIKRWLLVVFVGVSLLGIGFGVLVLDLYRTAPDTWWLPVLSTLSLRFIDRTLRAVIFGSLGLGLVLWGIYEMNRSLLAPFTKPGVPVLDVLRDHRRRQRGPRIVTIGGGTGLSTLLRGLKPFSHNITAVVTVADDGGSSGRLRETMGILPPGDIRRCLAALSDDEALLSQLFQYRFPDSVDGLHGHSFGNLFISALSEITGSFEEAVAESGRVLSVQGQVLPATLHDVRLVADKTLPDCDSAVRIEGESRITKSTGQVRHLWLEPDNPPVYPNVLQAILNADLIVIGPGSLYTSLLPVLLVRDIVEAIRASQALKVYVCNVATQPGETDFYTCGDHLRAIENHANGPLFDIVLANNHFEGKIPEHYGTSDWVLVEPDLEKHCPVYAGDLVNSEYPWRHDQSKLAQVIMDLFSERTGPLGEKN
ncbi:MAG: gluconeogenesis factor YvcK family protein [Chloroflexota bacterium]